jgi:hypothetical protein
MLVMTDFKAESSDRSAKFIQSGSVGFLKVPPEMTWNRGRVCEDICNDYDTSEWKIGGGKQHG